MKKVKITKVRSEIGQNKRKKATLIALGLRKHGSSVVHNLTPSIAGMIGSVRHLVMVEENLS